MNHLSLFSGIGGIDLAAEWTGFHSVAMVEKDIYCQQVLRKNFPEAELYGDILEFDGTKYENRIDLISAGFPCQPFSLAGSRKGAADERALWPEVVRVLREVNPTWFLGENVPGLLTSGQYRGEYFNYICHSLSEMGYRVGWCLYGAKDVGAVHRRNRVFIVAYSDGIGRNLRECNFRERSVQTDGFGQNHQEIYGKWDERNGRASADHVNVRDVAYSEHVRCQDIQEKKLERQDNEERKEGREVELEGSGLRVNAPDSSNQPRPQTNSSSDSVREERNSWDNASRSHWFPISGGNWREWDTTPIVYETRVEPRVRRANDGIPNRVDRLKCLGNAVVPQQVFPILEEIARQIKCV
jgi:DNA (cytosine-5)-methyltransferase 1